MQIVVKLNDVIIDPAKPVDLTAMPAERAIELLRKAYGFLAANMTFEIRDEMVVITVDYERRQHEEIAKDCFDRGMKQAKSGRYDKAVDLFIRVLKIVPEHTEARQAGKACDLRYVDDSPARARAIEEHIRSLARGDIGEAEARSFVAKVTDTLMPRLLLSPVHVLLEHQLWTRLPEIRSSQIVGMYLHARQKRNPLDQSQVSRAVRDCVRRAHETGGAAWAIFVDRMCGRRTAYAADYARCPGLPLARELADGWQKASMDFHPGDEYNLVREFVQALGIGSWLTIQPLKNETTKA